VSDAPRIDPSATVDPSADLAPGVVVEAEAFVGPECVLGARTRIRRRAMVMEHTTLGADNDVFPTAVLGGDPQDRKFDPAVPGRLIVGDRNVFREGVTLNRSVGEERPTIIGSDCYFMACSHAGHNAVVGDNVTLANSAAIGGHGRVGNGVFLSASAMVHQYCWVGELTILRGNGAVTLHAPPYVVIREVNKVAGLNRVGLQRSARFTDQDMREVKDLYRLFFRARADGRSTIRGALERADRREWGEAASRFLRFVREAVSAEPPFNRGLCSPHSAGEGRGRVAAHRAPAHE